MSKEKEVVTAWRERNYRSRPRGAVGVGWHVGGPPCGRPCSRCWSASSWPPPPWPPKAAGEANLVLPDLGDKNLVSFFGLSGKQLLSIGLIVCALGLLFGLYVYRRTRDLPVHKSMLEISELIYETCKAYLLQQGRFLAILWVFIAAIMAVYFGVLNHADFSPVQGPRHPAVQHRRHRRQLRRGLVRHPHQHVREQPHGVRQPPRQAVPVLPDPPDVGHEHRHAADQRRAARHAADPALHPQGLRGAGLHRLRHRRVAGRRRAADRRRYLHQDRRHRLRPDEDRLRHQGRRRAQPGRHRRLHR